MQPEKFQQYTQQIAENAAQQTGRAANIGYAATNNGELQAAFISSFDPNNPQYHTLVADTTRDNNSMSHVQDDVRNRTSTRDGRSTIPGAVSLKDLSGMDAPQSLKKANADYRMRENMANEKFGFPPEDPEALKAWQQKVAQQGQFVLEHSNVEINEAPETQPYQAHPIIIAGNPSTITERDSVRPS